MIQLLLCVSKREKCYVSHVLGIWIVSTDFKENPSVSVGIYFSLMSLYKGQLNN